MYDSNAKGDGVPPPVPGLELVAMRVEDLEQVLEIERSAFPTPWQQEHFGFEIRENRWAVNRVARLGRCVVGYTSAWTICGELKINNIAVHANFRRRGLGRWLLGRMLEDGRATGCEVARLEVRRTNAAARELYLSHGFVETGVRRGYYQREGEDAILMELPLAAAP
jgi:ribosomal-protein-alanine N-acetyltransferase